MSSESTIPYLAPNSEDRTTFARDAFEPNKHVESFVNLRNYFTLGRNWTYIRDKEGQVNVERESVFSAGMRIFSFLTVIAPLVQAFRLQNEFLQAKETIEKREKYWLNVLEGVKGVKDYETKRVLDQSIVIAYLLSESPLGPVDFEYIYPMSVSNTKSINHFCSDGMCGVTQKEIKTVHFEGKERQVPNRVPEKYKKEKTLFFGIQTEKMDKTLLDPRGLDQDGQLIGYKVLWVPYHDWEGNRLPLNLINELASHQLPGFQFETWNSPKS